jgi:soluble lytic murein transglycosylase-like protein
MAQHLSHNFDCIKTRRAAIRWLVTLTSSWALGVILLTAMPARGDIYRYVDRDGVVHFTNTPMTPGYEIYLRERRVAPVQTASYRVQPASYRVQTPSYRVCEMPGNYDGYIAEAARTHGVSFSLIKAVIMAESAFDPHAVSTKGACGLMQIMPATARELGVADPFDPRENILGGVRYLRELLNQFGGSVPLAVAAYNAGPGTVQSVNGVPPYDETQSYVQRVLRYLREY